MASNVVVDLRRARNGRRATRAGASGRLRTGSPSRLDTAGSENVRSVIGDRRAARRAACAIVAGAATATFLAALLWLGYVSAMAGASGAEAIASWLSARHDDRLAAVREVVVRSGDTLWSIARDHGPAGADVRETVDRIRRLNGMKDAVIYPGQVLKVPVSPGEKPR